MPLMLKMSAGALCFKPFTDILDGMSATFQGRSNYSLRLLPQANSIGVNMRALTGNVFIQASLAVYRA